MRHDCGSERSGHPPGKSSSGLTAARNKATPQCRYSDLTAMRLRSAHTVEAQAEAHVGAQPSSVAQGATTSPGWTSVTTCTSRANGSSNSAIGMVTPDLGRIRQYVQVERIGIGNRVSVLDSDALQLLVAVVEAAAAGQFRVSAVEHGGELASAWQVRAEPSPGGDGVVGVLDGLVW